MPLGTPTKQSKSEGTLMIWMNMLNMAVLLSANLGSYEPASSSGTGRRKAGISGYRSYPEKTGEPTVEGMVHFAGLMLLMALMVVVMYNDILKIF